MPEQAAVHFSFFSYVYILVLQQCANTKTADFTGSICLTRCKNCEKSAMSISLIDQQYGTQQRLSMSDGKDVMGELNNLATKETESIIDQMSRRRGNQEVPTQNSGIQTTDFLGQVYSNLPNFF